MESKRKWLFLAANLAGLAALLLWLQGQISLSKLLYEFKSLPTEAFLGALLLNVAAIGVYGFRFSRLLQVKNSHALAIVVLGFGMNSVLPFRIGEVAKIAYSRQLFGIAAPRLVAATAVEKLMDLLVLLLLGLLASQTVVTPYLDRGIVTAGILISVLIAGLFLAFLALKLWQSAGWKIHSWLNDAFDFLRACRNSSQIIQPALLTFVIWAINICSVQWMFGLIFPHFATSDAYVLTLLLALAVAIPSAPAGLGVVEAAIVAYLLQTQQADLNRALASALAFHIIVVVPQVLATAAILFYALFRRRIKNIGGIAPEKASSWEPSIGNFSETRNTEK